MFQSFETTSHPEHGAARLAALRAEISKQGLSGFLVPRADRFQGEYVADCDARLSWLTGFTGSAGFCAVLADRAGVFIDGRYRTQVKTQVDLAHYTPVPWPDVALGDWLAKHAPSGGRIGFDIWLHTVQQVAQLKQALAGTTAHVWPLESNILDTIWTDRPDAPSAPAIAHPLAFSGEESFAKRARIAQSLRTSGIQQLVITQPDSLCWLLNVRGADIARNPVVQGMCVLHLDATLDVFSEPAKFATLRDHLGSDVRLHAESELPAFLTSLSGTTQIDPSTAPYALEALLTQNGHIAQAPDPCALAKACKNPTEIAGADAAQLRDGVAMAEFLAWLDAEAPNGALTEIDVVTKLEGLRAKSNALREISFETIAGAGPNGAIMHYRVSNESNRAVNTGELLLVDSGGQYQDGTTDITRTIAVGDIPLEEKSCYTRVLKGLIAISQVRFPKGTTGAELDPLARAPLWAAGQDFNHGTGHGVGSYLSVHEGPQRLARTGTVAFETGMILSNEPGYYREGSFGIRLENLIVVEPAPALATSDPEREFLQFRTLTFTPFDRRLIDVNLLTRQERTWVDEYHHTVLNLLSERVTPPTRDWLAVVCAPLAEPRQAPKITIEAATGTCVIRAGGAVLGESNAALLLTEGSSAPVIYFPREDVAMAMLEPTDHTSYCPYKGSARYFSIKTKSTTLENAVWSYETPLAAVEEIAGYLAFWGESVAVEQL